MVTEVSIFQHVFIEMCMIHYRSNQTLYNQVFLRPLPWDYDPTTIPLPHTGAHDPGSHDKTANTTGQCNSIRLINFVDKIFVVCQKR